MQIIHADPTRMIDLPGVGPCPRPVDIDRSVTGFTRLKSLRIYRFAPNVTIDGESEVDEVYIVPLDGSVAMQISGTHPADARLSPSGDRALYMTPDHAYRLTPTAVTHVAYARARATGKVPTHVVAGPSGVGAEHLRMHLVDLAAGAALTTDAGRERLVHVISGKLHADGAEVSAGQTLALGSGESPAVTARSDAALLILGA